LLVCRRFTQQSSENLL